MKEQSQIDGGPAIKLSNGLSTSVDAVLIPIINSRQWRMTRNGYAISSDKERILLHRFVCGASCGLEVHHLNRNKLDNRRANLELNTAKDHQRHHRSALIERNKRGKIYADRGTCKWCGVEYAKDPDHRGRQVCCSKKCAIKLWRLARLSKSTSCAMLEERNK